MTYFLGPLSTILGPHFRKFLGRSYENFLSYYYYYYYYYTVSYYFIEQN